LKEVSVNLKDHSYKILIIADLLEDLSKYISTFFKYNDVCIITDENVERLYLVNLTRVIFDFFERPHVIVIPAGESQKNLVTISNIYDSILSRGLSRDSIIFAFGGGVIGDIAGFVASTYMRGIDYIQIPTTLLAQVDSSIGGKTGVNMRLVKI
jgi:3-dehydroquinate synthase